MNFLIGHPSAAWDFFCALRYTMFGMCWVVYVLSLVNTSEKITIRIHHTKQNHHTNFRRMNVNKRRNQNNCETLQFTLTSNYPANTLATSDFVIIPTSLDFLTTGSPLISCLINSVTANFTSLSASTVTGLAAIMSVA